MKLVDLQPRWIGAGGIGLDPGGQVSFERRGVGVQLDCPCGCTAPCYLALENPIDDGPAHDPQRMTWRRMGETFEDLTLWPSIRRVGNCGWHGHIEDGEIRPGTAPGEDGILLRELPRLPDDDWAPHLSPLRDSDLLPGPAIDVVVWGASRPDLFEKTITSFRAHARFSGQIRFFLEDGAFDAEGAEKSAALARSLGFDGVNVERVGSYGRAMTNAMARWVRAPLMFSLEDDWLCLRDIDLDLAWALFAEHPHVNQLRYNRRKNEKSLNAGAFAYAQRELIVSREARSFLGGAHWYFNPAVWRMSFVWPRWRGFWDNIHWGINSENGFLLPDARERRASPDWYADTLGVLTWGGAGELAFFGHIGGGRSIRKKHGRV